MISTDGIDSCKSYYHTISTAPSTAMVQKHRWQQSVGTTSRFNGHLYFIPSYTTILCTTFDCNKYLQIMRKFYVTMFILDFKYKIKTTVFLHWRFISQHIIYLHHINNTKKHNTILLNHRISEIIIKTTFNNTLKDGVTSVFSGEYT